MTPFRRDGSFHDTLMDVDEVASTLTFRGLPGPAIYIKQIRVAVFTLRTPKSANDIYIIESGVKQYPKLKMAQPRNYIS